MIMERTSRLAAARQAQRHYAAELDAQIAANKQRGGHNFDGRVGHRRGGSHGPGSHQSSSFVVPASQQAPFGTDPVAAPHRMHGRDHQAQGELYAAMPRRESVQARVQEQEMLYHSSVLGGEQRGTHAAAQSRVERQFGDDRQNKFIAQRVKQKAYLADLQQQIEMKNQRKEKEKQERLARERREEQAAAEYNPWGRGGAGAPLRNEGGQIVADYRSMRNHKSPTHPPKPPPFAHDQPPAFQLGRGRGQQPTVSQAMAHASNQRQGAPGHAGGGGGGGGGQGEVRHTRFQFSALSPEKQTEVMQKQAAREALQQQLREQIEEKQRRKAAEKEAEREWDRKEAARLARERAELANDVSPKKDQPPDAFGGNASPARGVRAVSPITAPPSHQQQGGAQPLARRFSFAKADVDRHHNAVKPTSSRGAAYGGGGGRNGGGGNHNSNQRAALGIDMAALAGRGGGLAGMAQPAGTPTALQLLLAGGGNFHAQAPLPSGPSRVERELLEANEAIRVQLQEQQAMMKQLAQQVSAAYRERDAAVMMKKAMGGPKSLFRGLKSPSGPSTARPPLPSARSHEPPAQSWRTVRWAAAGEAGDGGGGGNSGSGRGGGGGGGIHYDAGAAPLRTKSEFVFDDEVLQAGRHKRSNSFSGSGHRSGGHAVIEAARQALGMPGASRESASAGGRGHRRSYVSNLGRAVLRDQLGKRERGQLAQHEDVLRDFAKGPASNAGGANDRGAEGGDELDSLLSNFVGKRAEWAQ